MLWGVGVVVAVLVLGWAQTAVGDVSYPRLANIYFPTLIGADLEKLARYDVLVLAKRGEEWYRDELAELRELNPEIILLVHMPVGYAGDWETPSINGDMRDKLFEDDWWLRDQGGDRVLLPFSNCGDYLLNVSRMCPENSRGQMLCDWLPKFIADRLGPGGLWDGVYLDYCLDNISWVNGSLVRPIDADRNGAGDVPSELDAAWRAGMERVVSRLRGFVGPDYIIMTNGNNTLYESCDGSTREDFPNMHGDWYENITNTEHGYQAIQSNYRRPSINVINAIYHGPADPEGEMPGDPSAEQKLRFTLASTLVYGNGYFSFDGGAGLPDHCQMWWSELYELDLGESLGRAEDVAVYPGAVAWVEHPEMIRLRRFSRGLAVVNPTICSQSVQLGGIYYPADGFNGRFYPFETSEAQADLKYYSGEIYIGNGRVLAGVPLIECELLEDGGVRLVWDEVHGAMEYSVYRSIARGGSPGAEELIAVVNDPTYYQSVDGSRGDCTYRVAPIDEFGCEGRLSARVAATADSFGDLSVLTMADWPDGQPDLPWHEPGKLVVQATAMGGSRAPEQRNPGIPGSVGADAIVSTLRGCTPNPVRDEAMISFVVGDHNRCKRPQHVMLSIYTAAGRRVSQVLDAELRPGEHSVVWNRRTSSGARAPAGCYLYALTVAGSVMNGKMVLLH
jgi:hypothetical protein